MQNGIFIFSLLLIFVFTGCKKDGYAKVTEVTAKEELAQESKGNLTKRGEYLVNSIGCADCHSPKSMSERGHEVIKELNLSGYPQGKDLPPISTDALDKGWALMNEDLTAAVGPWGVSFAANITSDDTGIGTWSLEQFKTAIRKGKYKGMENGRDLLPPMPWFIYANLTDEDLEAIYTYLQSTDPVENVVPAPIPPTRLASK